MQQPVVAVETKSKNLQTTTNNVGKQQQSTQTQSFTSSSSTHKLVAFCIRRLTALYHSQLGFHRIFSHHMIFKCKIIPPLKLQVPEI
jgi:hypothetical protein